MHRALIRGLGALLLFGAGLAAGVGLASQTAPRRLRAAVEASLSEALGTTVSVASARLLVLPGVTIEAMDVVAWPGAAEAAFKAARLEASLDPAALLSGRLRFSSIALDGARLALVHEASGDWTPPLLTPGFESPLVVLRRLFAAELPAPAVDVRSGSLSITDLAAPRAAGGRARFEIDGITSRLLAPGLLEPGRLQVAGILRQRKGDGARFELEAAAPRSGLQRLELAAADLALDRFVPYLREIDPDLELTGRVDGVLSLAAAEGDATDLTLDLAVSGLRAAESRSQWRSSPLSVEQLGVEAVLGIAGETLTLSEGRLRVDGLELSLQGSIGRPVGDEARLVFEASLPELGLARLRELGAWLPADARRAFESATRAFVSGRFEGLSLSGDAPFGAWRAAALPGGPWLPAGVRLESRVLDLTLQPPGDEPVTAIRGWARLEGPDVLTVKGLEGRLGERSLPVLDLRLAGLQNLVAATPAPVPAVVPDLAGSRALEEILRGPPGDDPRPGWTSLEVDADWLLHPAFFRPLRGVKARLEPTPDGVAMQIARASWGGVPLRGEGTLATTSPERLRLSIEAGPQETPGEALAAPESWAHGRFELEAPAAPGLHVANLRGGFDLTGARLTLFDASASLGAPGRLTGDARLDLAHEGEVPAQIRLVLNDAMVSDLLSSLSGDPEQGTGTVDVSARLAGPLRPGVPLLATLEGDARITARDGELAIDLPILLAIAKASTTFNPFGSANDIRFDRIDAELQIQGGRIATKQTINIESPDLRLAVSGSVDVRERPHRLEAVVGCFFFKPLDQLLGIMPFVSRILLGPDRSLFGTYFELTGSWESPEAGLIPLRTLALGPASFLLQDVPAFVKRGIEAIQSVLPSVAGSPPAVASPAEAADPLGDGS